MRWNDVELIDGEFYFVDVKRWSDNEPNEWVFAYKENTERLTRHHVAANINDNGGSVCSIYDFGFVCEDSSIIDLRPATQEDMLRFWDYIDRWNYRYNLNTKKLRYVGRG